MIEVRSPVSQFFDTDGKPLDSGYIYVGTAGMAAESSPQTCYWDAEGTLVATQPIRTINGYPARNGAPTKFYTSTSDYSVTVKNKRGILVASSLIANSGVFEELLDSSGASLVGIDGLASMADATVTNLEEAIEALHQRSVDMQTEIDQSRITPATINLFANPAFFFNQRGYVSGAATGSANQYTLDRIRVVTSGQSISFAPSATGIGNYIICPAGGAEQVIEGNMISGGEYACYWNGSGTITVNGVARGKLETFTLTAGTNATIRMFGEIQQMQFTRPEMIENIFGNQFEYDYRSDFSLCQRYYRLNGPLVGWTLSTTAATFALDPGASMMRANPTITLVNGTGAVLDPSVGTRNLSSITASSPNYIDATIAASTNAKVHIILSGRISYSAEL